MHHLGWPSGARRRPARPREGGAIAVLAAICLLAVGAFIAFSLNVGHMMNTRAELQAAVDAAALAGAMALDGTSDGLTAATSAASDYGTLHALDRETVQLGGANDVTLGYWNANRRRFYPDGSVALLADGSSITLDRSTTVLRYYNAVKVGAGADGAAGHNAERPVFFSFFIGGRSSYRVSAQAVAVGGGPCEDHGCTLPLAVPSCALEDNGGAIACGTTQHFIFNHGQGKTIADADISQPSSQPNPPSMIDQATAAQTCANPEVDVSDTVQISNGNNFNSHVEDAFAPMVCHAQNPTDPSCLRRDVAVFDMSDCSRPMNQTRSIAGFVQVVIVGTDSQGADRSVDLYIDCGHSIASSGGCAAFGVGSRKLRIVQ